MLPAFVEEVPHYEVRCGQMYISMGDFSLAMPLRIFYIGQRRADEAIAKWRLEHRGEVVQLPHR